ncbi:ribosome maturation factor RimM [Caenispirillum bisanense]|uniref:Ribosome maturation factor RimM n=1 Tax=Caenispirillum bisanense TaxID=414052 RepID=A0A286G8T6_9PROT|nr:ribosome maturation factor RimM [Caenispirillum bisanense]SOD91606.1 16S rRNA processing protein RimM [Caenispirillum bisanense]
MAAQGDGAVDRVLVGVVVGAHGIRGDVKVKSFTGEPEGVAAYGPVQTESGQRTFSLRVKGMAKGTVICAVKGVADRNAAEALKGTRLYLPRTALPPQQLEDDEYYHADLVGLTVEMADGSGTVGTVAAVYDFGAGDILEVTPVDGGLTHKPVLVPFTRAVVPVVDIAARRLVIDPPAGLIDESRPEDHREASDGAAEADTDEDEA